MANKVIDLNMILELNHKGANIEQTHGHKRDSFIAVDSEGTSRIH